MHAPLSPAPLEPRGRRWRRAAGRPAAALLAAATIVGTLLGAVPASAVAGPIDLNIASSTPPKPAVGGVSELNVLSFNLWNGASGIPNGPGEVAKIIQQTDTDVAFLPEKNNAPAQIAAILGYQQLTATDTGIISRYPILASTTVGGRWTKAILDVNGTEVAVYGGHLEYRWYSEYLPRAYGPGAVGNWPQAWKGWGELPAPVTDVKTILDMNAQSGRIQSAEQVLADAAIEQEKGRPVLVGGDFNEPSVQDWTEATKDLFDHRGTVVPWQTTKTLLDGGLLDSFRVEHPDPVRNPGITWPSYNPIAQTTWAPKADERDRIDYIFYAPGDNIALTSSQLVGPQKTVVRNVGVADDSDDVIFTPNAVWPSDHKAVLSTFRICADGCTPPNMSPEKIAVSGKHVAGGQVEIHGSGFMPNDKVSFRLDTTPVPLGTATADAKGKVSLVVTIPASTLPGTHTVVATVHGKAVASKAVHVVR
ncbi:endonuclease/exonuclease/phosphatase family protein [Sphaerisporangium sp. NPDC051017]|uniref:endonuclease/exonuclease/phosphatase family protein n=1 Tax=Sphaerisporangium sp. NPDC051017 TaxID=3154636 RepID=UPI003449DD54